MTYAPSTVASPVLQVRSPLPIFARIVSFGEAVLDVLAFADRLACAARARYPFAD